MTYCPRNDFPVFLDFVPPPQTFSSNQKACLITVQNFRKRRDLRFDGILSWDSKTNKSVLSAAILDKEGCEPMSGDQNHQKTLEILESTFDIIVVDDNRSGEIVLLHKSTKTLIISDLLYKSDPAMVGPGGTKHRYTDPEWFAQGRNSQCLFLLVTNCL